MHTPSPHIGLLADWPRLHAHANCTPCLLPTLVLPFPCLLNSPLLGNLLPSGNKACSRVYHTPCADLAQPPASHWACPHCIAATPVTTTTSNATSICAPSAASSVYHSYGEGKPRTPELPQQWQHHQASAPTASAFLLTPPDSVIRTTEQHAAAKAVYLMAPPTTQRPKATNAIPEPVADAAAAANAATAAAAGDAVAVNIKGLAMEQAHGVAVEIAAVMSHREGGDGGSVKSNARKESLVRMAPKVLQLAVSPVKNAKLESGSADDGSWFARNKLRIEHAATSATTLDVGNSLISAASFTASAAAPAAASTATSPPALQLTPRKKAAVETMLNLTTTPSVPLEGSLAKAVAVGNVEDSLGESGYCSSSAALRSEQPAIKVEDVRIFAEAEVEVDEIRHMLGHSSTSADVDGCKGNAAVNIDLVAAETILNLTTSMGLQQNSANNNLGSAEQAVKKVKVALTATSTATPTSEKGKEGRATKYVRGVNGRYECPHCYLTFSTSHGVDRHVERNCSTLFPNKWDSFSIQNPPAVTKTRQRVACPHCSSDFTNNDSMTRHIEKSCPELFPDKKKQKASKQDHEYVCNSQGRYECPNCDADFASPGGCARHDQKSCPTRFPAKKRSAFPTQKSITEAVYTKGLDGRYLCPHCNASFTRDGNISRHVQQSCPTLFPTRQMRIHSKIDSMHTQKPNGRYECPHCEADFARDGGVSHHIENSCPTLFPWKKKPPSKTESLYARSADGRYKCPHCEASFAGSHGVSRHVVKNCPTLFPEKKASSSAQKRKGSAASGAVSKALVPQNDASDAVSPKQQKQQRKRRRLQQQQQQQQSTAISKQVLQKALAFFTPDINITDDAWFNVNNGIDNHAMSARAIPQQQQQQQPEMATQQLTSLPPKWMRIKDEVDPSCFHYVLPGTTLRFGTVKDVWNWVKGILSASPPSPSTLTCPCGRIFASGQALGGHRKRCQVTSFQPSRRPAKSFSADGSHRVQSNDGSSGNGNSNGAIVNPALEAPSAAALFDAESDGEDVMDSSAPLQQRPTPPIKPVPTITFEEVQALIKGRATDYGYGPMVLQNLNVYEVLAAQMRRLMYAAKAPDRTFVVQEFVNVLKTKLFAVLDLCAVQVAAGNPERTLIRLPSLVAGSVAYEKINSFRWPKTANQSHKPECWPENVEDLIEPTTEENQKSTIGTSGYYMNWCNIHNKEMGVSTLALDSGVGFNYKKENKAGGVMLGTRIKVGNVLHATLEAIAAEQQMNVLCPAGQFKVGPYGDATRSMKQPVRTGGEDDRHFLITGWKDAYTPMHVDSGVQTVLYHNVQGLNRFVGIPSAVAAHLWAAQNEFSMYVTSLLPPTTSFFC